ncbi:hypothetical protein [Rhizobium leguminosarum]|uniref:hypothetical protein n=1 Tax=Rhizobium leguminosarum TaxID=384 RepID=UPI001442984C|nr:hypothetical protein [Rhizobium leguminosarum]MBY5819230.1 hypothetical protein [Rhizobium leguminosarum]NKK97083.1 hypothetical protein [Rhizobium leguminosarum bv. viciae]NKL79405.1 hypothetical protein [Rhizobium leguminosarum bv. viciae]
MLDGVSAIDRTCVAIDHVATRKQLRGKEAATGCALLQMPTNSQPDVNCHRRPLPDRHWRCCSGHSLLGISGALFKKRGIISWHIGQDKQVFHIARERGAARHQIACIDAGSDVTVRPWRRGRLPQDKVDRMLPFPHTLGSLPQANQQQSLVCRVR